VSLTVDGETFSHTVLAGALSAENVYDALKAVNNGSGTLANKLSAKGVTWAGTLSSVSVTLTSNPGTANAFTVVSAIDNDNDAGLPWVYTVNFDDDINNFTNPPENITITIGGTPYQAISNSSSGNNSSFDNAAAALVTI